MRVVSWLILVPLVMVPFPEFILGAHRAVQDRSGLSVAFPLVIALTVSLLQMWGEYGLIARAGHQMASLEVRTWWEQSYLRDQWLRAKRAIRLDVTTFTDRISPSLKTGGYLTMFVCSANPFSFLTPPFVRLTGVVIWRTAKLPGSVLLLTLGTLIRLTVIYAGILGTQWALTSH